MKTYLLCPFGEHDLQNKIFETPYGVLRDLLKNQGIILSTYDQGEIRSADKVLFFNHNESFLRKCLANGLKKEQLILFLYEPRVVLPGQYYEKCWKNYCKIFTYYDDLVDNNRFFKMNWPQGQRFLADFPDFHKRKFLTLINANKYSYNANELYSFRRKAIRYFESHHKDFDLFGYGWNDNSIIHPRHLFAAVKSFKALLYLRDFLEGIRHYESYQGKIDDKYDILSRYKFAICFENEKDVQGWISEKIFDCFFTGTIPIYLGADNIQKYIPANCYIDMREFANFSQLDQFINQISEKEFCEMQNAGQEFIRSQTFTKWRPEGVFKNIINHIV